MTLEITLTDAQQDVLLEVEAKRLAGSLGVQALIELLLLSEPDAADDDAEGEATPPA